MLPSARLQIAGERKGSRWDQARLVLPLGAIVVVAIVCIVVAVVTSARRADEVASTTEQQLIKQSIFEHGQHALHLAEGVTASPQAIAKIRDGFDPQWIDQQVGSWLAKSDFDLVAVVGADDNIEFSRFLDSTFSRSADLAARIRAGRRSVARAAQRLSPGKACR